MASANKMFPLKYSCEEVYERMEKGLCIFCDELDIPGHHQLKHKGIQIFLVDDDLASQTQETVTNPKPIVETANNSDPFIEPLERASVLQVLGSVPDVLMVHRIDSHVKEVEESSQQSTNGNDKIVAHQLFDQMPNPKETIPKETIWDSANKEFKETVATCGKKTSDRCKLVHDTSKPAVYDRPFQIRVWDSGGSPLERVDEESSGDDKSSEVIAADTVVKLMHKPLMYNKYSFVDESSGKDVKVLEAQQGFKTQVCSGFDVKALIGLETYGWEYKKQMLILTRSYVVDVLSLDDGVSMTGKRLLTSPWDNQVWEPGGVSQGEWKLSEKCYELSRVMSLMQGLSSTWWSYGKVAELTQELQQPKTYLKGVTSTKHELSNWSVAKHVKRDIHESFGSKGLAYDGCVLLGMNFAGFGRGKTELLVTSQKMQRPNLFSFCCSCKNHIVVVVHTEIKDNLEFKQLLAAIERFSQQVIDECAKKGKNSFMNPQPLHDKRITRALLVGLVGTEEKLSDRLSLANYVWKPGELLGVQDQWDWISEVHNMGSVLKIMQRFHGLHLQGIINMDMRFREVIVHDVLSAKVCLSVCNRKFEAELEVYLLAHHNSKNQKIAGGLIYGDVNFHLKHKWRSRLLQTLLRLEFCVDDVILFTSSVKLLFFTKNHKPLHPETGFCTHYNGLEQLSTEFQGSLGLNFFTYLIFKWNQALNCGCEAGHTSSGFFSVGDVYGFFTCSKLQTGDETQEKRLLFLNNNNKVGHTIKENWFHSESMIRGVFHLQRPPELIELQGNPNFITKVLVQWKEHPPDQFFSGSQWQEFNFSSLRTRMFRRGKYCDRIISNPGSHKPNFSQSLLFMVQL